MVYAITLLITFFFLILYLLLKREDREEFCQTYTDDIYKNECKSYVRGLGEIVNGGSVNDNKIKFKIRYLQFLLKRKRYKGIFDDFCAKPDILKAVLKVKFSCLESLPFIGNQPRCVMLARFMLKHSDYIFTQDRFSTIVGEQNKIHTLTYSEISFMKEAFLYVLLEKVAYILANLHTIAKVQSVAKRYVADKGNTGQDKGYKSYTQSKLFLDLCKIEAGYSSASQNLNDTIDELYMAYSNVLNSMQWVLNFDFSRYYTPLEILDKYPSFSMASENQKHNFLTLFEKLSDKENIDEFMYAIRLDKYLKTSTRVRTRVNRVLFSKFSVCILTRKNDISLLCAGLSSDFFMSAFFGQKSENRNNSILKIADFENTFEPIYKFENVNFGISIKYDILKVNPHLPKQIESADLTFSNNGVKHALHLVRSNKSGIYLGNTQIDGTHYIRLGGKPLDILVEIDE